jgi:hypothetical protein
MLLPTAPAIDEIGLDGPPVARKLTGRRLIRILAFVVVFTAELGALHLRLSGTYEQRFVDGLFFVMAGVLAIGLLSFVPAFRFLNKPIGRPSLEHSRARALASVIAWQAFLVATLTMGHFPSAGWVIAAVVVPFSVPPLLELTDGLPEKLRDVFSSRPG